jgi:macrodomain Ter protein organizer (MatP/YcbG family)
MKNISNYVVEEIQTSLLKNVNFIQILKKWLFKIFIIKLDEKYDQIILLRRKRNLNAIVNFTWSWYNWYIKSDLTIIAINLKIAVTLIKWT